MGVVGYYQRQVSSDKDSTVRGNLIRGSVVALGPEASLFIEKMKMFVSLRFLREFGAQYKPEGNTFTLTLTKAF